VRFNLGSPRKYVHKKSSWNKKCLKFTNPTFIVFAFNQDLQELRAYLKKGGLLGPCMWFRAAVSPVNVGDHGSKSYFTLDYLCYC